MFNVKVVSVTTALLYRYSSSTCGLIIVFLLLKLIEWLAINQRVGHWKFTKKIELLLWFCFVSNASLLFKPGISRATMHFRHQKSAKFSSLFHTPFRKLMT